MHAGSMTPVVPMMQMPQMNPMYNSNNPRNCHHYCQHQCYRQQPMNTNPGLAMGFGNININSDTGITGSNMMRHRSEHAMSPDAPEYMQQRNMGYPSNSRNNVPHQHEHHHQMYEQETSVSKQGQHQQEAFMPAKRVSNDNMAQHGIHGGQQIENQMENEESGCRGQNEQGGNRRMTRAEITLMNPIQEQQETNEQHQEHISGQAHDPNEQESCEPGYGNKEQEDCAGEERYEKCETRNKREISKGLTSGCAKSLIYFQGPNSDYSRMEAKMEKDSTTVRNRRLNQPAAGQAANSSQSQMNLHHQSSPTLQVLRPARKISNKNEGQPSTEVPLKETKSCVTYGGEQIMNSHENNPQPIQPITEEVNVENATGDMHPDGHECHHSDSAVTIGDCLKLNPLAKITRRARGWDDVKRRNGLE